MKLQLITFLLLLSTSMLAQRTNITNSITRKKVENQINTLLTYVSTKNYAGFASNSVSRRDDPAKKWKAAKDTTNAEDIRDSKDMIKKIDRFLAECSNKKYESFTSEKESEGIWYVYTYQCGQGKKIRFAFLLINGNYLLGDINTERP